MTVRKKGTQRQGNRGTIAVRGYGLTPWSRAFVDVVEGRGPDGETVADSLRITKARRYFRDRHVHGLRIASGSVTASVEGTQLDPFDVLLTTRTVDTPTLATLLRDHDAVEELMLLTRGEQPPTLGELLVPTESADVDTDCTCPDDAPRCIHALVTCYEIAAEIDRSPLTLLTVMGTDLRTLLGEIDSRPAVKSTPDDAGPSEFLRPDDFYGTTAALPPLPAPPRMNPLTALDGTELRAALRATGVAPADIAEAIDELGDLYDRLTAGDS
ncbi:SWIM zinc finger family protein [Gordonia sp. zg691]|uniref:SWIM zinc finger family protein n=1 Tax=Gordonia jinghuaiqii TaxID=2758710 RepID=UPI001662465B|nr:SWIM zinc finger family protein [Gordonia jinghuaiqii]MBD0859760.1 SWIM zinc finger family protein [Gordonia jinghuaiqii]